MSEPRPRVVVLGAGGHAAVVLDILGADPALDVAGVVCPESEQGFAPEFRVLGTDQDLQRLASDVVSHFIVGVGSVGDASIRRQLFMSAQAAGLAPINAVHRSAIVASSAVLGRGVAVMAGAVVNPRTCIGDNCIVNTGAIVEHDCVIGEHAHIATGAHLGGGVRVGAGAHVGAGATVKQGVSIGDRSVVGLGAAVIRDVEPDQTVVGVPARPLPQRGGR